MVEVNIGEHTHYPPANRGDRVDSLGDHRIADPYRWLEDADRDDTRRWSSAQDELARRRLDELPGRAWLTDRLSTLMEAGSVSAPLWRAGLRFHTRRAPGQEHAVLYVTDGHGSERPLLDPTALDPSGLTTLDSWLPDLEGRRLAYRVSRGGDEESVLHVLDIATGEPVGSPIDRCRNGALAWLPGGEEFFYVRMVAADEAPAGEQAFHRRVWRHRVGESAEGDQLIDGPGLYTEHTHYGVAASRDGRWLVVSGVVGTTARNSLWIAAVSPADDGPPALTQVLDQDDDVQAHAWVERDGRLYILTAHDAPRWRLMVTEPERPGREHWRELVAEEPDAVLESVRWLQHPGSDTDSDAEGLLVLARARHAVAEVTVHRAGDGTRLGTVPLPGTGSLTGLSVADRDTPGRWGQLWLGWTGLVTPPEVHRFELAGALPRAGSTEPIGATVLETPAPGGIPTPAVRTEQRTYHSTDGTPVRMFVVRPESPETPTGDEAGPAPALLTGYGGFGISRPPVYSSLALAWVAAGGVYALASLRGGGEEGEDWHRAGMRDQKQHVFDDLHAAADSLVASGDTTHGQLGILGGSNGGLLVGAALTQHPEKYRAVVCSAPLLDMVRYERFSIGRFWSSEYGSADDPAELEWLLSYSPYHHVRPDVRYPAVLFTVFDADSRVDPAHARKMCAALQFASASDPAQLPVLLRRERDVGHATRSVSRSVGLGVDQLAFLAAHTGLELP
ncbi:MAG TPA: prolyl oligopeptidase family serine peptidase [Pseudonocardia sp.]|nr:prolyl oligopeptidase family serine peptidase [Pseudonocardia sp.]